MTARKNRQVDSVDPVDRLMSDVRTAADVPYVISVDEHFAGYFNELGITVGLLDTATDSDVIVLRNTLLDLLESASVERKLNFKWLIEFQRGGTQIAFLFPGDGKLDPSGELLLIGFRWSKNI